MSDRVPAAEVTAAAQLLAVDARRAPTPFPGPAPREVPLTRSSFEGHDLSALQALVTAARPDDLEAAADTLAEAASAIRGIGEELRRRSRRVDWRGRAAEAFREWSDDLSGSVLALADYAADAGVQLKAAGMGLAMVRSAMPRGTADDGTARQEALTQLTRLGSYYQVSHERLAMLEEPRFRPLPDVGVPLPPVTEPPGAGARAASEAEGTPAGVTSTPSWTFPRPGEVLLLDGPPHGGVAPTPTVLDGAGPAVPLPAVVPSSATPPAAYPTGASHTGGALPALPALPVLPAPPPRGTARAGRGPAPSPSPVRRPAAPSGTATPGGAVVPTAPARGGVAVPAAPGTAVAPGGAAAPGSEDAPVQAAGTTGTAPPHGVPPVLTAAMAGAAAPPLTGADASRPARGPAPVPGRSARPPLPGGGILAAGQRRPFTPGGTGLTPASRRRTTTEPEESHGSPEGQRRRPRPPGDAS